MVDYNNIFKLIEETEQLQQEGRISDFGRRVIAHPAFIPVKNYTKEYIKNDYIHPAKEAINVGKDTLSTVRQYPTKPRRWLDAMNSSYIRQPNLPRVLNDTLHSVQTGTDNLPGLAMRMIT